MTPHAFWVTAHHLSTGSILSIYLSSSSLLPSAAYLLPLTRSSLFLGPGLASPASLCFILPLSSWLQPEESASNTQEMLRLIPFQHPARSQEKGPGHHCRELISLPKCFSQCIFFSGKKGSFSGLHAPENWWLSWEGCYSKASQSCCTKKERQRLEKRNDRE